MTSPQPDQPRNPAFVLNGHSVHVEEAKAHIARISAELGAPAQVIVTRKGDNISQLAARAIGEGRHPVAAGGGDGTVNAVAGMLAGTSVALGVLPMGTLNHFAKDAGIPRKLEAAVRNVFTGEINSVDVGDVNGRVFVNNSGLGFYPHFVRIREDQERRGHVKRAAFMLALRSMVRRYLRLRFKVHMDRAEAVERVTPFLFVGNNRYQTAGLEVGRRLRLDSGLLWVCTAPRAEQRNVARMAVRTLLGRETEAELNAFEVKEISIEPGTPRVNVSVDGEVTIMNAPLNYRIRPLALRVVAPGQRVGPEAGRTGR
jgi:diacylglycerol kinase family enzyme